MRRLLPLSAHVRLLYSLVLGILVGFFTTLGVNVSWGVLVGLTVVALAFVVLNWLVLWPMDPDQTQRHAMRERYNPVLEELLITIVAVISMVGLVMVMVIDDSGYGSLAALVGLAGVFLAWAMLHVMYTTQYAHVYFSGHESGGLDFGKPGKPRYIDFLYFSFMVGMTYGTTDVGVLTTTLRAFVLRHGLLSFVFGTVILATGVSLVSGIFT
ncbi:DUF1345 domain-containing protein [Kocuria koreensis]|jgi:uncharacterized membrane protein|uniref:DUF1345 domain-containing protein n=1 Tax=Rothia koreensis TaxID=592378 RepID=A0A7K1LKA9_9MICC|nr:DUF1345 domain-containing protein [Rothia koreensis]MUN55644.1 DUF1345 domain-containing protein [Rothia koreensis]